MLVGEVVVGNQLNAFLFAYYNKLNVIVANPRPPKIYENICLSHPVAKLTGPQKSLTVWSHVLLNLSLHGSIIGGTSQKSVRILDDKIKMILGPQVQKEVKYDKCYVFDSDRIIFDAKIRKRKKQKYAVYDWINVRSGSKHDFEKIETLDTFVSGAYFYKSERIDGASDKKDAVCFSILTEEQLQDFEYSDTMARFKLEHLMRKEGITGTTCGKGKAKIKLEADRREVVELESVQYVDKENIKFMFNRTAQGIADEYF